LLFRRSARRAELEASLDANFRMELQYDGTGLRGWAKQPGLLTVEGSLECAFGTALGATPRLCVAGRTDAGVHARRQVVSVRLPMDTDTARLTGSLNALTPDGIVIDRFARAPLSFDARRDASSRVYRYFLSTRKMVSPFWSRYCWDLGHEPDLTLLNGAALSTLGRHDFTGFTPAVTEHSHFHRTVLDCAWSRVRGEPGLLCMEIEADAFLRHMVRALVGTMVEVAEGKRGPESYRGLLGGTHREAAGVTAPAQGLFLWDIRYGRSRHASSLPISVEEADEADE
jgi:tRNA pseudouridine38-40 synthase